MAKLLLWICIGVGGTLASLLPMLWGSQDFMTAALLSVVGSLLGIVAWYKLFRYS